MRFSSFFEWLHNALARVGFSNVRHAPLQGAEGTVSRDAFAATRELLRLLADESAAPFLPFTPDMADASISLGNLFRAQGDIDRAVKLREALLARVDSDQAVKGRIFFELGCDYRKAGLLDRALSAYKEARKLEFSQQAVSGELIHLFADSGDFASAAVESAAIGNPKAEAFFLVRQAEERAASGNDDAATRLIRRAIAVCPGAPEAWLAFACMNLAAGNAVGAREHCVRGLAQGTSEGRLILLEGLHVFVNGQAAPEIPTAALHETLRSVSESFFARDADLLDCYYAGLFMQRIGDTQEAEQWFTKALMLEPNFWAARLALLALVAGRESLPPLLSQQIAFFTRNTAESKRFFCKPCGMRCNNVFSFCPRCRAWHSVSFRLYLN